MGKSIDVGCEDRLAMDERHIYPEYAQLLTNMAFAYMLTGDEKYLAMKDRLLTMARLQRLITRRCEGKNLLEDSP